MSNKNSTTVVKSDLKSVIVNARYHISDGNKKLVPNKDVAFLVWNIPAVSTCPFRTRLCGGFLKGEKKVTDEKGHPICYALKAETAYKQVLPARKDNLKMSLLPSFVDDMTGIILDKARRTRKPRLIVRIHESGDFYNQVYADKWLQIMRNCECESKITFIAYTKSFPFFDGKDLPKNFSLRASVMSDTAPEMLDLIVKNDWNIYTAVEKFTDEDTFSHCRCEDCAGCGKCWNLTIKDIRCEIH